MTAEMPEKLANLIKQKEQLELQISNLDSSLVTSDGTHVAMHEPLVDSDGFPRSDLDVVKHRSTRVQIIQLRNDLQQLMKQIDVQLQIHFQELQMRAGSQTAQLNLQNGVPQAKKPIALVEQVLVDSPAYQCELQEGDQIVEFGRLNSQTLTCGSSTMEQISQLILKSQDVPLMLVVKRSSEQHTLKLVPSKWEGDGLTGCIMRAL